MRFPSGGKVVSRYVTKTSSLSSLTPVAILENASSDRISKYAVLNIVRAEASG